ncbi:nucleoside deaminase [Mesoplasma tabanidae]|uniref:tRNA-specific adenosine deaminase n=1 Tax=Mesoplasma tabanidae TaxID=219745 RepID=A0A2K8P5E6_9MOLU|nr:nucleoside deaminase [Mesoplasma tabanidae]ATZ21926.1 tRNA-specific adenosine deaminase [Mesoplasma tabanidae]
MINLEKYIKEIKIKNDAKDVPVFACLIKNEKIIFKAYNNSYKKWKITGHAEINVINKASQKNKSGNLSEYTLFTTLEPCLMCYGAIKQAKINNVTYLTENIKMSFRNYVNIDEIKIDIKKLDNSKTEANYIKIISDFFKKKRN